MAKVQNHVENTVDNLRDSAGNAYEINAAYLNGKGAEEYVTTDTAQATLSIINSRVNTNENNILSLTQSVATLEDTSKQTELRLGEVEQQIPQLSLSIGNLEAKVDENTQSILSLTKKTDKIADNVEHIPRIYTGETIRKGQRKGDFFILEETGG